MQPSSSSSASMTSVGPLVTAVAPQHPAPTLALAPLPPGEGGTVGRHAPAPAGGVAPALDPPMERLHHRSVSDMAAANAKAPPPPAQQRETPPASSQSSFTASVATPPPPPQRQHQVAPQRPSMLPQASPQASQPFSVATVTEELLTKRLCIGFEGVTVQIEKHVVLERVGGLIAGGCLTGLVSCCGARGDYVLLSVLSGFEESCGGGTVLANGIPVFAPAFRHSSVLIDEDFTTQEELTVRQNLHYAASMRTQSVDNKAIDDVIATLSLESVEHRPVSRCSEYVRRRVALGKELLLRPRAIFVDQPVQGLATHEGRQYLQILKRVAEQRKAIVVVTLVQPRWVLLELLDSVIMLEGRHVAFSGSATDLLKTLRVDADHIPDSALTSMYRLASSPECSLVETMKRSMIAAATTVVLSSPTAMSSASLPQPDAAIGPAAVVTIASAVPHRPSSVASHSTSVPMMVHHGGVSSPGGAVVVGCHEATQAAVRLFFGLCAEGKLSFEAASYATPKAPVQFYYLVRYALHQVRNNLILYSALFALVLVVSIALAAIYSSQTGQSGMQNRIGIIFFLVSSTFLHNMLFVEGRRRECLSFQRHCVKGYYGAATYLAYTVTSTAFLRFFSCAVFTIIVYSLGNLGNEFDYTNLRDLVAVVALTSFSTNLLVYLVSSVARTARVAHFVLFTWYTFDVILAGIILNVNTLPKPFQMISLVSHVRLGFEAAVITQFVGQNFGCTDAGSTPSMTASGGAASTACYTGDQYLSFLGFHPDRRWPNVEILLFLSGATCLVWYGVLLLLKPNRRVV